MKCADCQSMVPELTQAGDGMNTRRTLVVILNECLYVSSSGEYGTALRYLEGNEMQNLVGIDLF